MWSASIGGDGEYIYIYIEIGWGRKRELNVVCKSTDWSSCTPLLDAASLAMRVWINDTRSACPYTCSNFVHTYMYTHIDILYTEVINTSLLDPRADRQIHLWRGQLFMARSAPIKALFERSFHLVSGLRAMTHRSKWCFQRQWKYKYI